MPVRVRDALMLPFVWFRVTSLCDTVKGGSNVGEFGSKVSHKKRV